MSPPSSHPGEAVLFIHSTGTFPMMWVAVPAEAFGGRTAILPANLGYPPNPAIARGTRVTVDDEVAHVLSAVPSHVAKLHVVAHSYGGTVALAAIEQLGPRLASMFLAEPVLFGALRNDTEADPAVVESAREFASSPLLDEEKGGRLEWLEAFIDYWNRPGAWARLPEPMREHSLAMGWKMYQEVRACFGADKPFDAYAIDVPTTLAIGERTTAHSRAMTTALARRRPNVVVAEMSKTGHMAPLTHPALVAAEIAKHFSRLDGRDGTK